MELGRGVSLHLDLDLHSPLPLHPDSTQPAYGDSEITPPDPENHQIPLPVS
jgi:hypothetical protein